MNNACNFVQNTPQNMALNTGMAPSLNAVSR